MAPETATFPPDRPNQARFSLSRVGDGALYANRMIGDRSGDNTAFGKRRQIDTFDSQLSIWAVFTRIRDESIIIISLQKVETAYDSFDNVKAGWAN